MAGSDSWDDDEVEMDLLDDPHAASGLASFDDYAPTVSDEGAEWTTDSLVISDETEMAPVAFFTVSNPPGTVSATAMIGGRIRDVDILDASSFTESQLADEIVVLADLAKEKALAAQHAVTVELMRGLGHDRAGTSGYLQHAIGLPAPDVSSARMAELFAARYPLRAE